MLVDLPSYVGAVNGKGSSGFSDVAPAVKWQISPLPGKFDLSAVFGMALPTGAASTSGRGLQPYVQFPWSWEVHDGWGISGMLTEFFRPSDLTARRITETTIVLEKKLTERFSAFAEYVGDYPDGGGPSLMINSGGLYRLSKLEQVDFHLAFGLNHNAPKYIVGIGYSFRVDGLFAGSVR